MKLYFVYGEEDEDYFQEDVEVPNEIGLSKFSMRKMSEKMAKSKRQCLCEKNTIKPVPRTEPTNSQIRDKCKELLLTEDQLRQMMRVFQSEVQKGLAKKSHDSSSVKCFVTYVQDLPTGKERGKFLALDLGGTNFRVLLIELSENHFEMRSKIFAVPKHIMVGSGEQLFDHIADCLAKFMKEEKIMHEKLPLGFTFSFPLCQLGLTKGILQRWTKGFNCSGVVNNDVVQFLEDAIARRGDIDVAVTAILNDSTGTLISCAWVALALSWDIKIEVCAVLNDTTGTLMSCAWKNRNCKIGLIVGTGTNACYVEKQKNAEFFDDQDYGSGNVLINLEWGAFGDFGQLDFVITDYDRDVDKNSVNPGLQLFEKMISGMYLGELVRLAIARFTKEGLLFGGKGSDLLFTRGRFYTKYVSEIESDFTGTYTNCKAVMEELGLGHATEQDFINVRYLCECMSRRAAHMVSATLAVLLIKMNEPHVTIGIDGSLYRYHPHFHQLMMAKISQFVSPNLKFDLMLSEDGSGRGAALVAAVAYLRKTGQSTR